MNSNHLIVWVIYYLTWYQNLHYNLLSFVFWQGWLAKHQSTTFTVTNHHKIQNYPQLNLSKISLHRNICLILLLAMIISRFIITNLHQSWTWSSAPSAWRISRSFYFRCRPGKKYATVLCVFQICASWSAVIRLLPAIREFLLLAITICTNVHAVTARLTSFSPLDTPEKILFASTTFASTPLLTIWSQKTTQYNSTTSWFFPFLNSTDRTYNSFPFFLKK